MGIKKVTKVLPRLGYLLFRESLVGRGLGRGKLKTADLSRSAANPGKMG